MVSVLMAAYNAERYISHAIQSVLDQSFQDFELIVYNDGSTDDTAAVVKKISDSRILFIDNVINKGLQHARNTLLKSATGKYVAILDSDDIALPNRLEKLYHFLEAHPRVSLCGGNALVIDGDGRGDGTLYCPLFKPQELKVDFFFNNVFVNSSVMFRRDVALEVGGYRDLTIGEDYDLFVRMADRHEIHVFHEPVVHYRIHGANISLTKVNTTASQLRKIKDHQLWLIGVDPVQYGAIFDAHLSGRVHAYPLQDFYAMFVALKNANRLSNKLPIDLFERELYRRWYELVVSITPKKHVAGYLLKKELFSLSHLTAKQARRIAKFWLRSLF